MGSPSEKGAVRAPQYRATALLQIVLLVVALARALGPAGECGLSQVECELAYSEWSIDRGEWARLLSASLINNNAGVPWLFGWQHLIVNSVVLWVAGPLWEGLIGFARFWMSVLLLASVGYIYVYLLDVDDTQSLYSGGSSSITWGICACTLVIGSRMRIIWKSTHWRVFTVVFLSMIVVNLCQFWWGPSMGNWVHLFSGIAGVLYAFVATYGLPQDIRMVEMTRPGADDHC